MFECFRRQCWLKRYQLTNKLRLSKFEIIQFLKFTITSKKGAKEILNKDETKSMLIRKLYHLNYIVVYILSDFCIHFRHLICGNCYFHISYFFM